MEKLIYEIRPYVYLGGGIGATLKHLDGLMLASGVLLIATSAYVLYCRAKYRAWLAT